MQIHILSILCLLFPASTIAATIDSVGVENSNGKKIILHKIEAKETYYSLGRKYNVTPKDIIKFNNNTSLQIGTLIKVPTERPFQEPVSEASVIGNTVAVNTGVAPEETLTDYKVGPKETLYAIAKRFNMSVDDIKQLNNLKSSSLSIGQIIKVRTSNTESTQISGKTAAPEPVSVQVITPAPAASKNPAKPAQVSPPVANTKTTVVDVPVAATRDSTKPDTTSLPSDKKLHANKFGLREVNEKGIAIWMEDENVEASKMLVLHKTAPVGTVIKITNPMTDRSTFAKVVGKFNENESTKDVVIVVTKATASLLGALDKRFQVNLVYGVPNTPNE